MPPEAGAAAHFRALESLYAAAPINKLFESRLEIVEAGVARISFTIEPAHYHAGGAAHGTSYFKMLDDAAFYAANSLVSDRFLLTTQFNLLLTRPVVSGEVVAEGELPAGRAENADPTIDWGVERIPTVCVMEVELDLPERPAYRFVLPDTVPLDFDAALLERDEHLELILSG